MTDDDDRDDPTEERPEVVQALDDPTAGVVLDPDPDSDVVVAFGGLKHSIAGSPPFEFFRMLETAPANRIFIRDLEQLWYQKGIHELGSTIVETAPALRDLVASTGSGRLVMIGSSAGGFGAILFGCLLGADAVLAFGPQTFVDPELRAACGDDRWQRNVDRLQATVPEGDRILDLAGIVPTAPDTDVRIFVGSNEPLDVVHGEHLAGAPNVTVETFEGRHNVAKLLRRRGRLGPIIDAAITGAEPTAEPT